MSGSLIIDSHIHTVAGRSTVSYGWTRRLAREVRDGLEWAGYVRAITGTGVGRAIVVEFLADDDHHIAEAELAHKLAGGTPLIAGFVASAPVERGATVAPDLDGLLALSTVRAIRRVARDGRLSEALNEAFVAGVRTVGRAGLPFEIAVQAKSLPHALALARQCPDVTFVLDHLGTPPIMGAPAPDWKALMQAFSDLSNVVAKLSGLMAGVDRENWRERDVVAHLKWAIDCFGPDRVMYGSDWPMFAGFIGYSDWLGFVQAAAAALTPPERDRVFGGVASDIYRLHSV